MESIVFCVCLTLPLALLWLNVREMQKHINALNATNQEHGDRFTALSNMINEVKIDADHAVKTLNDNARKFGIPYFKNR